MSWRLLRKWFSPGHHGRHFHWDWTNKEADLRILAFSFIGISAGGKLQGLMKLENAGRSGRIASQKGKPLTYVDYLETAPWNIKSLMQALGRSPEFAAVGTRLIEAAVRKSLDCNPPRYSPATFSH